MGIGDQSDLGPLPVGSPYQARTLAQDVHAFTASLTNKLVGCYGEIASLAGYEDHREITAPWTLALHERRRRLRFDADTNLGFYIEKTEEDHTRATRITFDTTTANTKGRLQLSTEASYVLAGIPDALHTPNRADVKEQLFTVYMEPLDHTLDAPITVTIARILKGYSLPQRQPFDTFVQTVLLNDQKGPATDGAPSYNTRALFALDNVELALRQGIEETRSRVRARSRGEQ